MTQESRSRAATAVPPAIAAVVYENGEAAESALRDAVALLRQRGVRVAGLVQSTVREHPDARCRVVLENLDTGGRHDLTQNLGTGSQSCALDATALADASRVVREALAGDAQLVVISKFGALEAAGGGFRDEFTQVVSADMPLLTTVSRRLLGEWQAFAGELAQCLAPRGDAIVDWWEALQSPPAKARPSA